MNCVSHIHHGQWAGALPAHDQRYRRAEEYVQVLYKLLEGSWEDDAVVRDTEQRIYTNPAKIHDIDHVGEFYDVVGPHLSEPSAQLSEIRGASVQGIIRGLIEAAPDKSWTFGDMLRYLSDMRIVGTPEQIADELAHWADAGADGINFMYHTTPGSFADFIGSVPPVLQQRGLQQREYRDGTMREKLFDGRIGPLLSPRHPGAAVRRERLGRTEVAA